ncbi:bifunctional DNA primase/polymerase [Gordonia sputi]|uniref:bifunctional DNA primase/polymerase n=1 Tax=Gordonia sputi TaxID=36823 RepID=UPI00367C4F50
MSHNEKRPRDARASSERVTEKTEYADQPTLSRAALQYSRRGWPVFRLQPNSKRPTKGSCGFHDATTDPDVIRQWWTQTPTANIGLAIPPGMIVLDCDLYKEGAREALADLERKLGQLPPSPTVRTAGGGLHFYFTCPADAEFAATAAPGIDIRTGGKHYVVAPPSIIDGVRYEWI